MKSLTTKLVLSALAIAITSPAFAKKAHQVTTESGVYSTIPGYDKDGAVVGIPSTDQTGAEAQR
jgi:hypothetical protein